MSEIGQEKTGRLQQHQTNESSLHSHHRRHVIMEYVDLQFCDLEISSSATFDGE